MASAHSGGDHGEARDTGVAGIAGCDHFQRLATHSATRWFE